MRSLNMAKLCTVTTQKWFDSFLRASKSRFSSYSSAWHGHRSCLYSHWLIIYRYLYESSFFIGKMNVCIYFLLLLLRFAENYRLVHQLLWPTKTNTTTYKAHARSSNLYMWNRERYFTIAQIQSLLNHRKWNNSNNNKNSNRQNDDINKPILHWPYEKSQWTKQKKNK